MTIAAGSIQSFAEGQIGQNDALHPRHFDESEAEWRNLTPKCGKPMVAGDFPALRFIRALSPCHPYRRVSPSRGRKVQRDHLLFPLEGGKETGFIGEQSEPRIQ